MFKVEKGIEIPPPRQPRVYLPFTKMDLCYKCAKSGMAEFVESVCLLMGVE